MKEMALIKKVAEIIQKKAVMKKVFLFYRVRPKPARAKEDQKIVKQVIL